ncbi:BLUF domain-containing protein [Hydrogenophaga palleronii]|uniref:BLUF domain-containing protein n=1 Tax=Hydrogenophaga palleronii TaxID=65655 RepID=UPI000825431A|nr:BLUF domain-containing protein [Hydrogenophaga palleronii]
MNPSLSTFFYHSRAVPGLPHTGLSQIIHTARSFNAAHGITGMLVFDGERFCQFIEGPPHAINSLVPRLRIDARHTDFTEIDSPASATQRLYPTWSMGYAVLDGVSYLDDLLALPAADALARLLATQHQLDVN